MAENAKGHCRPVHTVLKSGFESHRGTNMFGGNVFEAHVAPA